MSYVEVIKTVLKIFPIIALFITLPYFIVQYHKIGAINKFKMLCFYLFVLYCLCIYFLVILPLPSIESVKNLNTPYIQYIPFNFINDIIRESEVVLSNPSTWITAIKSTPFLQAVFNFIMLLPLGIFCRYLFDVKFKKIIKIGFLTTIFFELTQLSGLYGIYPRPYRLFDIDDIILNFSGCILGYILLPVFKFVPKIKDIEYDSFKKINHITFTRRMCGLILDFMFISFIETLIGISFNNSINDPILGFNLVFILYFILFPYITNGYTPGKKIVGIKLISDYKRIKMWQLIVRYILIITFYIIIPFLILIVICGLLVITFNNIDLNILTNNYIKIYNFKLTYDIVIACFLITLFEGLYYIFLIKNIVFYKQNSKRLIYERASKTEEINVTKYKSNITKA